VRGSDRLDDLGVEEKMILKRIFKKRDGDTWNEFIWLTISNAGGLL
jgi:hypothetical protein